MHPIYHLSAMLRRGPLSACNTSGPLGGRVPTYDGYDAQSAKPRAGSGTPARDPRPGSRLLSAPSLPYALRLYNLVALTAISISFRGSLFDVLHADKGPRRSIADKW